MESLPLEVVEMVVRHISGQDLAACCAASHSWRDIFNRDIFWKHLCKQETAVYLSRTPCRVEPAFISPGVEGSELEPVCQWWMNFMRENHLLNNWRSGRCRKEQLEGIPVMRSDWIYDMFSLFYQEDFVIGLDCRKVELWDLRGDPVPYVEEPCCLLPCWHVCYAFLCGHRLIVVQHLAVQVFQINLMQQSWPPEHTFFFEEDEPTDYITATNFIHHNKRWVRPSKCFVVGKYLIAINTKRERSMHIWDVEDCFKLKEEKLETTRGWRFFEIKPSTTSLDDIIVILYIKDTADTQVLVYSLFSCTFYPSVYNTTGYCDLYGDKIVVIMKDPFDNCLIENYKTGERIHRIEGANCSNFVFFKVFDNKFIYISGHGLNQINLSSGEVKQFIDAGAIVKDFQILGDKFVCMQVLGQEGISNNDLLKCNKEVWEICSNSKRLKFCIEISIYGFIKANSTNTKLIIEQDRELSIINIW